GLRVVAGRQRVLVVIQDLDVDIRHGQRVHERGDGPIAFAVQPARFSCNGDVYVQGVDTVFTGIGGEGLQPIRLDAVQIFGLECRPDLAGFDLACFAFGQQLHRTAELNLQPAR